MPFRKKQEEVFSPEEYEEAERKYTLALSSIDDTVQQIRESRKKAKALCDDVSTVAGAMGCK